MVDPIVDIEWLERNIAEVVVCHVVSRPAHRDRYLEGHIPQARQVSLDDDLAGAPDGVNGRHPLPTAAEFAATLAGLGIHDGDTVVAYDGHGGAFAARMVWMLRVIGQRAALLDGGVAGWSGELETGDVGVAPTTRQVVPWPPDATADADDVARHIEAGGIVIDSRDEARYRGDVEPIDAVAGHVPGALNRPFADNLADGRFRSHEELSSRFAPIADTSTDATAIVYCGSGVTACHNALAIEQVGMGRPRVYIGSWSGWSTNPLRAVERS